MLVVTNMWPTKGRPQYGIFVRQQVEHVRRAGVGVDVLFVDGSVDRRQYLLAFARLRRQLRSGDYQLIHAHYVLSGLIARAQRRLPIVLTHHGIEVMQSWQSPLCYGVSRLVDEVIVTTSSMRERLAMPDAAVIPCGVDLETFRPLPRADARVVLGLAKSGPLALFVGEDRPEKRLDLAVRAAALAGVPLHHVHGEPPERVALFMNAADVLVLPSDNEGSPQVVKEALACDLPVVATDVGAVAGLIGGVEGCHLASQSPPDIAAKLRRAVEGGRSRGGRASVAPLSLPVVAERVIGVYERVLG